MVDKNRAEIIQKIYKDKEELERSFDFLEDMGCTRGISRENLKVLDNISEQVNRNQYKGFYGMLNDSQIELVKVINCKSCRCMDCTSKTCSHCKTCSGTLNVVFCREGYVFLKSNHSSNENKIVLITPNEYFNERGLFIELKYVGNKKSPNVNSFNIKVGQYDACVKKYGEFTISTASEYLDENKIKIICKSIGIDMNDILLLEGRYMIGASDKLEFCADMPGYYVEEQDTKSRLSNIDWEFYKEMAIEVYPLVFVLFTALYVAVLYSK